ncbi:MAG: NAD(P)H-dependent oxidoreductase [Brevefilum sp.]|nr:NAD(P)H-dependent oxidoreductase [Brevefilum sp.]
MRYCVVNGSPRGKSGNTAILLESLVEGIESTGTVEIVWFHLNDVRDRESAPKAFRTADVVVLGFPLYTDSMPGLTKAFIESLAPFEGLEDNPRLAFLVQSGFPEAQHSRFVERYLQKLAQRLNAPYAGTVIKGGCEGVRLRPQEMNQALFKQLCELGVDLAQGGKFDQARLENLAKPEHYPRFLATLFQLVLLLPVTQAYWINQLKKNGAYDARNARPFVSEN